MKHDKVWYHGNPWSRASSQDREKTCLCIKRLEEPKTQDSKTNVADGIKIGSVVTATATDGQRPVIFRDTAPEGPDAEHSEKSEQGFE